MLDILFINSTPKLALNMETNGTMLLATKLLQAGFSARILRFGQIESYEVDYDTFIRDMTARILELSPRCLSFYTLWPYYHIMLRIAREVKALRPDMIVVMGGPQASATARATLEAMDFVDYICTGEGEHTVVPFFTSALGNPAGLADVPGLYFRKGDEIVFNDTPNPLCDLNALPRWDERLYAEDYRLAGKPLSCKNKYIPIDVGRGCPFRCTFCSSSTFWHRAYRLKSAETILADIRYYMDHLGATNFLFSHDAFTVNKDLVHRICDDIIASGLNIHWKCTSRIDCVNEELLLKMKQAGMTHIDFGVETGSARMQKLINKNLDLSRVKQIAAFLLKEKIHVSLFFMYGFPEETEEDLNETLQLVFDLLDLGIPHFSMSFCRFNPSTLITQQHFDQLVFDPDIKVLQRSTFFGHAQELPMITAHKAVFPFFYHLNTPVRNNYQYLVLLTYLYEKHRTIARYLREYYQGDNLRFYKDFVAANHDLLQHDMNQIEQTAKNAPMPLLQNLVATMSGAHTPYLCELLRFYSDYLTVSAGEEGASITTEYGFSFIDYQLKLPLSKFSEGKTKLLLQKINGKVKLNVLAIK